MTMELHLFLPQMRMTHAEIVERALAAEAVGFEGVAFMDHLAPPLAAAAEMWEAMSLAGWVLANTTTLTVGHLVLCDSLRHPAVLARQVTSLDHASAGRFELGIGWGSVPDELRTFGICGDAASVRAARLRETLEILRGLWSGDPVDHIGEHFTLIGAQQLPVPTRRIPITIGGVGDRTLELVRDHADWWNVPAHRLEWIDSSLGRTGDRRISVQVIVALLEDGSDHDDAVATLRRRLGDSPMTADAMVGTVDQIVEQIAAFEERGVERIYPWFSDFAPVSTLERFAPVIEALR